MDNFKIPQLTQRGTPEWVQFQMALARGVEALKASAKLSAETKASEVDQLQRIWNL